MEGIVLFMVVAAPWFFGSVDPFFEYLLYVGVAALATLWAGRALLRRSFAWISCPVALSLGLLFLIGAVQLVSLPNGAIRVISPMAGALNAELRPTTPEVLSAGEPPASQPVWPTITYDAAATRTMLARILAVLLLFTVVRNNLASTETYQRLAWIALANGVLLSLFGLWQFAAFQGEPGPRRTVFGYVTLGDVFGPFICRNHFAFYINMCVGLGIGLFAAAGRTENEKRARRIMKTQALVEQDQEGDTVSSVLSILHSPVQLWVSVSTAVMIVAIVASMSRGGVAAFVIATVIGLLLRGPVKRASRLEALAVPILIAVGIILWLGINPLATRLNVLREEKLSEGRLEMWANLLPAALAHPITGTGYGTLPIIEPVYRSRNYGADVDYRIDHAHNDYLEAFVEGGLPRLVATFAIVWALVRFGRKAMSRHAARTPGHYALGATIAVLAVAVHSFVDFGMFTPAVAVLAAVVAAHVCTLSRSDPTSPPSPQSNHVIDVSLGGWGGVVAAAGLVATGLVLTAHGSRQAQIHSLRLRAHHSLKSANLDLAVTALSQAIRIAPAQADLRVELGQVYLDAWLQSKARAETTGVAAMAGASLAGDLAVGRVGPLIAARRPALDPAAAWDQLIKPGLRQMIAGRDLCPLLPRPHARLAAFAADARGAGPRMTKSDPAEVYWTRVLRLAPYDPDLLYFAGRFYFDAGQTDPAIDLWRRSVERRSTHLQAAFNSAMAKLGPQATIERMLPDDPEILIMAARSLAARPDQADVVRRTVERAKSILTDRLITVDAADLHMLAQCYRILGQPDAARSAFEQALALDPRQHEWRYEFAEFLYSLPGESNRNASLFHLIENLKIYPGHLPSIQLKATIEQEFESR